MQSASCIYPFKLRANIEMKMQYWCSRYFLHQILIENPVNTSWEASITFEKPCSSSLLTTNVTLGNEVLLLISLNCGNIVESGDGKIDISTLFIPSISKLHKAQCSKLPSHYFPISTNQLAVLLTECWTTRISCKSLVYASLGISDTKEDNSL